MFQHSEGLFTAQVFSSTFVQRCTLINRRGQIKRGCHKASRGLGQGWRSLLPTGPHHVEAVEAARTGRRCAFEATQSHLSHRSWTFIGRGLGCIAVVHTVYWGSQWLLWVKKGSTVYSRYSNSLNSGNSCISVKSWMTNLYFYLITPIWIVEYLAIVDNLRLTKLSTI